MKRFLVILPILMLAWGCTKPADPGLQQTVYPPTSNDGQTAEPQASIVKVGVIAIDDAGKNGEKIGCNDSLVFVDRSAPGGGQPLNEALKTLFSYETNIVVDLNNNDKEYYTALPSMAGLKFDRAAIDQGIAKIYLTGSMAGLGGVCDSPRVPAQIEGTAKQFPSVTSVETYLNNTKVDWQEFSSQK